SAATLVEGNGPPEAFRLDDVKGVAVEVRLAEGTKCARSWKILPSVGSDPAYPDVSPRDAQALREGDAMRKAAEQPACAGQSVWTVVPAQAGTHNHRPRGHAVPRLHSRKPPTRHVIHRGHQRSADKT